MADSLSLQAAGKLSVIVISHHIRTFVTDAATIERRAGAFSLSWAACSQSICLTVMSMLANHLCK